METTISVSNYVDDNIDLDQINFELKTSMMYHENLIIKLCVVCAPPSLM